MTRTMNVPHITPAAVTASATATGPRMSNTTSAIATQRGSRTAMAEGRNHPPFPPTMPHSGRALSPHPARNGTLPRGGTSMMRSGGSSSLISRCPEAQR